MPMQFRRSFGRLTPRVLIPAAALIAFTRPAFAIPSPELVVGSISSLSQLAALLSALIGGGAIAAGSRSGGRMLPRSAWHARLVAAGGAIRSASPVRHVRSTSGMA